MYYKALIFVGSVILAILAVYGWLVGCFGLNGPLRQCCRLYQAVGGLGKER